MLLLLSATWKQGKIPGVEFLRSFSPLSGVVDSPFHQPSSNFERSLPYQEGQLLENWELSLLISSDFKADNTLAARRARRFVLQQNNTNESITLSFKGKSSIVAGKLGDSRTHNPVENLCTLGPACEKPPGNARRGFFWWEFPLAQLSNTRESLIFFSDNLAALLISRESSCECTARLGHYTESKMCIYAYTSKM